MDYKLLVNNPQACRAFNRNLGSILKRLRKKRALSTSLVSEKLPPLSAKRLCEYESGLMPVPANLLFELVGLYEENWFDIEVELAEAMQTFSAASTANEPMKKIADQLASVNDGVPGERVKT